MQTLWYFYRDDEAPHFARELDALHDEGDCDLRYAIICHRRLGEKVLIDPSCPVDDTVLTPKLRISRSPGESVTYGAVYSFFALPREPDNLHAVGLTAFQSPGREVPWQVRRLAELRLRSWQRWLRGPTP